MYKVHIYFWLAFFFPSLFFSHNLFSFFTSNLTTQPRQIQKTSKSTTHKPLKSNQTSRQALTSKSLCHTQIHLHGLVTKNR
jgi:hypothetical protein